MNGGFSVHDLLPYMDFAESVIPIGVLPVVVAEPKANRVALQFIANQSAPLASLLGLQATVSTRQDALPGEGWSVSYQDKPFFSLQSHGPLVVARWYGTNVQGVLSLTVFEWFWKAR